MPSLKSLLGEVFSGPVRGGRTTLSSVQNLRNLLGETFYPKQTDSMGRQVNAGTAMDWGWPKGLLRVPMTREDFFGIERNRQPFIHLPDQDLTLMPDDPRGTRALLGEDEDAFAHADLAASFLDFLRKEKLNIPEEVPIIKYGVNPGEVNAAFGSSFRRKYGTPQGRFLRVADQGEMLNLWPKDRSYGGMTQGRAPVMGEVRYPSPINNSYYDYPSHELSTRQKQMKLELEERQANPDITIFEHERDVPPSLLQLLAGKFPDRQRSIWTDDGIVPGPIMRQAAAKARRGGMAPDQFHADLHMKFAQHKAQAEEMAAREAARLQAKRAKVRVPRDRPPPPKLRITSAANRLERRGGR